LKDIFYEESKTKGNILLDPLLEIDANQSNCNCLLHRWVTLLVEKEPQQQ
jgi:hypothetical protein